MPKTIDKDKLKFNKIFIADLRDSIKNKNGFYCYFCNEKSGLTLSLLKIIEKKEKCLI